MVNGILSIVIKTLMDNGNRDMGFGAWCLRKHGTTRLAWTGKTIKTPEKYGVYFKAGKSLRERVHEGKENPIFGMRKGDSDFADDDDA